MQNRNMKIPSMGFTDNYTKKQPSTTSSKSVATQRNTSTNEQNPNSNESFMLNICDAVDNDEVDLNKRSSLLIPDQEILDSTEEIYFQENVDTGIYELNVSTPTILFNGYYYCFFFIGVALVGVKTGNMIHYFLHRNLSMVIWMWSLFNERC